MYEIPLSICIILYSIGHSFPERLWILFVFLLDFFVIAILRTVRGYEILKFTFKSELVSKSETLNKSL